MQIKDLRPIGQYLYGGGWQSALAKDLRVNLRTVQRWASGDIIIKLSVADKIYQLAAARQLQELLPVLSDIAHKQKGLPCEIELKVYGDNVTSVHKRTWSPEAELAIKTWLAEFLNSEGMHCRVIKIS